MVARYVDPSSPGGPDRLRALEPQGRKLPRTEVPQPPRPERLPEPPPQPTLRISRASDWVAGMQRSIRDFADSRECPEPLVRVTLDDGERLFLEAMRAGPDDDFVTFTIYEHGDDMTRVVVLRLDAIRKVELLAKPPSATAKTFVFHPRKTAIGFATGR